ncbi:MAG TPA: undecaprenyl-diphosphatase UppP [Candidatus Cloacimonadota bacterium]|nr:undecaprenyl-diphosphatase UppP [Candidatus Cloacimonadota bacterium]
MDIIKSLILGIIQGLTEFLPISSSGHLVLARHYLNFTEPEISFEIVLHLGSLIAVLVYFWQDIKKLIASLFVYKTNQEVHKPNRRIVLYILVVTIVTGILGFAFSDLIKSLFAETYYASAFLLVTGLILFFTDRLPNGELKADRLGLKKSIIIGLGQSIAMLPGISRSGTTIATGIFTGLDRKEAARFSFLISIPAIIGANISEISAFLQLQSAMLIEYLAGLIAAFATGYAVIAILLKIVQKQKLHYFSYYCWLIGSVTLLVAIFK